MWSTIFLERTNYIVTGLTASFVLYTRSVAAVYFVIGATLCAGSVKILKTVLQLPRPVRKKQMKKSYGMPSTHSATITYYAIFISLACSSLPIHNTLPTEKMIRTIPILIALPWASIVVISRVWLGHHTWPQVLAGSAYGATFAYIWYLLWTKGWNEYGQILENQLGYYSPI